MTSDIRLDIRNLTEVTEFIKTLPAGTKKMALTEIQTYIIGDARHGLKHAPPYKYVSRKQAYGQSFFTDRQRKWFFWSLNTGRLQLPYKRTGSLAAAWKRGEGENSRYITNDAPYASLVQGDNTQSRHSKKIGWRTASQVVRDNIAGALRQANQAVQRWLNSKGR